MLYTVKKTLRAVKFTIKGLVHFKSLDKHTKFKIHNSSARIKLNILNSAIILFEKMFQKRSKCVAISDMFSVWVGGVTQGHRIS